MARPKRLTPAAVVIALARKSIHQIESDDLHRILGCKDAQALDGPCERAGQLVLFR